MKRCSLPAFTVDNAHDDLSSCLVENPFLNVGLCHLTIRAPVLSSDRIDYTSDYDDDILLLGADLSKGLIEFGGVGYFNDG